MGLWERLRGSKRREIAVSPYRVDLVPSQLAMRVVEHDLSIGGGKIACWTFQSDGLTARSQKDLVLTFARRKGERIDPLATEVAHLLEMIWGLAADARTIDIGGFTEFGERRFLGKDGARGLGYLRAQALAGVAAAEEKLAVIPLFAGEVDAVKAFGITRVAARLGEHYRFYPWPPWWDRDRPVLGTAAGDDASVLGKAPHVTIPGLFASIECPGGTLGSHLTIRVLHASGGIVAKVLASVPPRVAFAIVPEPDPGADALMVWHTGDVGPGAISPPGSTGQRLSVCFVIIVPEQTEDDLRVSEDGVSLLLRDTSWDRLRELLISGQSLTLSMSDGRSMSVERVPTGYAGRL